MTRTARWRAVELCFVVPHEPLGPLVRLGETDQRNFGADLGFRRSFKEPDLCRLPALNCRMALEKVLSA
jgi:hypothetical protein